MIYNLNKQFLDYKGNPTKENMADKIAEALYTAGAIQEWPIKREDKFKAYQLCQRIMRNPEEVNLSSEDITLIKSICINFMIAGAYGQVEELLECR